MARAKAKDKTEPARYRPCVGAMIVNRDGLVWIGRRSDDDERLGDSPRWQMPQGGIDAGEDPRTAVLREVHEETGARSLSIIAESARWLAYDLPRELIGKAWNGRYRGQTQKWFLIRFDGEDDEFDIVQPAAGHAAEFDAWRWVAPTQVAGMIVAFKRPVYEAVVAEFAPAIAELGAARPRPARADRGGSASRAK